jgi:hypothetical protein
MATVTISKRADGIVNVASGSFTSDGSAQTVTLGFVPLHVLVVNETDVILWEKFDPMVAANCIKVVTAGTTTVDTGSAIVINSDGTLTLSATLVGTSKAIKFIARR